MKILVWQWGRRGGGPRYAVELAAALRRLPGVEVALSLSAQSELLRVVPPPECELPYPTYDNLAGFLWRWATMGVRVGRLTARLREVGADVAICAMPGLVDLEMAAALRNLATLFFVVVHDADAHPGDGLPLQMTLQRRLCRRATGLVALSTHVAAQLRRQHLVPPGRLLMTSHPPRSFVAAPPPPRAHGGPLRLLSFGRLLPYKGLDLLAEALRRLGPRPDLEVRVVGSGPESPALTTLRQLPGVTVENRWVPEAEVGSLFAWADGLVLSHREASQSGGAAAAVAARRWVVATSVGGIAEQLRDEPMALLCDPAPDSLANALRRLLEAPPPVVGSAVDPGDAWREVAGNLVRQMSAVIGVVPARPQPGLANRVKEMTSAS
jgi:glycosyltransferase involved in cell wall biosynthesis